ncbi:CRIB domain-containing protein RIC6-like [Salvia divinorum]|uniref:CRIB domain-containing protein RIC6-like n=1 Tax=Salvia divinorum TaxID=28513 RepID=A0ABD1GR62_SALDI
MTTASKPKMKGIFKGFKYISQIFEEEKDEDIQIGFPTDVKHVAHIGWDGPAVESPSWMNQFSGSPGLHSAPLGPPTGGEKGEPEIKWVSEDPSTKRSNKSVDLPDVPKSSRRSQSAEGGNGELSPKKQRDPNKVKQRRNHSRDTSEGGSVKSNREPSDPANPGIPDPAKKSRRKKSRESNGTGGSTRARTRANADPGPDGESSVKNSESDHNQNN